MSRWSASKFYSRLAPVASSTSVGQGQGRQGIVVRGRDHILPVRRVTVVETPGDPPTYSETLGITNAVLDPTDAGLFPWMSKMAKLFQTYKILDLKFVYEPQCPSTQNGLFAMWYDPDPTNYAVHPAALDMGDLTQRGVSVHGALWAKHMLSVPQSLCASRSEYYIKESYPPIYIKEGQFRFDPLEYFPGLIGFQFIDQEADYLAARAAAWPDPSALTKGQKFEVVYGRVYVEYSIAFGKAESSADHVQAATTAGVAPTPSALMVPRVVASSMESANHVAFRAKTGASAISTPCYLYGESQIDSISNVNTGGNQFFTQDSSTKNLVADRDCEFVVHIGLTGTTGAWNTTNAVRFEIRPAGKTVWSQDVAGVLALGGGQRVNERYFTAGGIVQSSLTAVKLNKGDSFRIYLANNGTIAAWSTTSPGYSIRMYACAFGSDAAPFP